MHRELSVPERVKEIETNCRSGALACGDCKKMLGAAMEAELGPVRERGLALRSDKKRVLSILRDGGARARTAAEATMGEVREVMGLTTAGS
jgi:tryptophanyl-tRNA synthetase